LGIVREILFLWITVIFITSANGQQEEIKIITNQDLYISGESIYFQVSCNYQGAHSNISQIVYLELIDQNQKPVIQQIRELEVGKVNNVIFLPSSLETGNYVLIAYTSWMKNFSRRVLGTKLISVLNPFNQIPSNIFHSIEDIDIEKGETSSEIQITMEKDRYSSNDSIFFIAESVELRNILVSVKKVDLRHKYRNNYLMNSPREQSKLISYTPEPKGHVIKGRLRGSGSSVNVPISINLTNSQNQLVFTTSDSTGDFSFVVAGQFLEEELTIKTDPRFDVEIESPFLNDYSFIDTPSLKIPSSLKSWILERAQEVQIEDNYFMEKFEVYRSSDSLGMLDYLSSESYYLDDYTRFPKIEDPIVEFIPETRIKSKKGLRVISALNMPFKGESDSTLILLNGTPVSSKEIFRQNPNYIEKISVYQHHVLINQYEFAGIVHFQTFDEFQDNISIDGIHKLNYSNPEFRRKSSGEKLPHFEHQLLWFDFQISGQRKIGFKGSVSEGEYQITVFDQSGEALSRKNFFIGEN